MSPNCHYCGVTLADKNHSLKENVFTDEDKGETAPICDDCYAEKFHEQAKAWCLKNLRPIQH